MSNQNQKVELTIELIKSLYPLACFALSGTIAVCAAASSTLPSDRWVALIGLSGSAIAAGAGIAQSPHSASYKRDSGDEHEEVKTP